MKLTPRSKVLIATFSPWKNGRRLPINGNVEPMLDFFTPRVSKTALIDQVYPESDFLMPRTEIYKGQKLIKKENASWYLYFLYPFLKIANSNSTHIAFKLRDLLSVIDVGLRHSNWDYFIGFEAVNALGGILLKKIGKVGKVVYYVSDYSPQRYSNKWFNRLYLWLDRYAAKNSDVIWDVSPAMQPARMNAGLLKEESAPILIVPNALYPQQIKFEPFSKIDPQSIVFMGTLGAENGPDLAIESLPLVLKKYPNVLLHIVGGGREEDLRKLAHRLRVEKSIVFHGFIADREEVSKTIRKFMIGLAPYINFEGSPRLYGDATKIRAYMAAGLPVITTTVPPLGREVLKKGAGIVVNDKKEEIAGAIISLLKDKNRYAQMRKCAIKFAKNNTWDNEYRSAFKKMELL